MGSEEECGVCCGTANDNKVKCMECQYEVCRLCVQKYILGTTSDPHCMNCRKSWDILFLRKNLDKGFMSGVFKEHWKKVLIKRSNRFLGGGVLCPCPSCFQGKILENSLTCSSCWIKICGECHCHLDSDNHICRQDTIMSLNKILKSTKKCPGCSVPIEKKSGCFQMFCTQCYTAFDWQNGGVLEKNKIHNPHYFSHQKHRSILSSFPPYIDRVSTTNPSFKWVCKEFYNLVRDIEYQVERHNPQNYSSFSSYCFEGGVVDELYNQDEARRQDICQHLLWMEFYKKGLVILREIMASTSKDHHDLLPSKIHLFKTDLKEKLIDYNEYVAECLQLRGGRLFPCNPPIICM